MSGRATADGVPFWGDIDDAEARQRYQMLVDAVDDGIYQLDAEGHFVGVNDMIVDATGYSREDLLGEHVSLVLDDSDVEQIKRDFRQRFEAGDEIDDVTYETTVETVDRELLTCELQISLLVSDGEFRGSLGIVRDVTERKQRERHLKVELDEVVERITDGFFALDTDWDITHINERAREILEAEDRELVGTNLWKEFPEAVGTRFEEEYRRAMEIQEPTTIEEYYPPLDIWFEEYLYPSETGMSVYFQDITERKQREQRLEELVEGLEESNERLEQFAYAASHDLQEPLRMVSSYLKLIEQRYAEELDEDGREFIDFAVDSADRMRDMIDGLLNYSRVETQGDPFEPVDLDTVLADVRTDLQIRTNESEAEITTESLPRVEGDEEQLRQVFQNLLDNAIEYNGDEPPQVAVSAERDGPEWVVSVSDEGIGIDPDDADRVFEVFQSLHTRDEHAGTGIGLAMCERIIERHGGDIWVDSAPGEGSTFSFTLPAVRDADS